MSKSFKIAEGFEVPVNTTTVLIAAVIAVPLLTAAVGFMGNLICPAETPICYASRHLKKPMLLRPMPDDPEAETLGGHIPEMRQKAIEAQSACQPHACTPEQRKTYTHAVDAYLSYRMAMMAKMELNYAEPGLDYARKTFSSPQESIENGFIARHASGDYNVDPLVLERQEAIALLTDPTRGRRYFEPCPTPRAPITRG